MSSNVSLGFFDEVKIRSIRPTKCSLRSSLGNLDGLMSSIQEKGVLQPIVVRLVEGGYEVVAGNRRFEACRRLKWAKVPCHIVELDDKEAFEISLTENVQRETLNPLEEAMAFKKYMDDYGYGGISHLAERIGRSQEYVSRRIQLLELPDKVKDAVMRRRITPSIAQELHPLLDGTAEVIMEAVIQENLSSRDVRRMVRSHREAKASGASDSFLGEGYKNTQSEERVRRVNRALARCVASLKVTLMRFDETLDYMEDDWIVTEAISEHRRIVHDQIDNLLNLRDRVRRVPSPDSYYST